jgi:hypothetical protein
MNDFTLWASKSWHQENNADFRKFMRGTPQLSFFHPTFQVAPWHVQAMTPKQMVIDFWRHKMTAHGGGKTAEGHSAMDQLLEFVTEMEDFDVIE